MRWSIRQPCCSGVFVSTNRMFGRTTALQIASASVARNAPPLRVEVFAPPHFIPSFQEDASYDEDRPSERPDFDSGQLRRRTIEDMLIRKFVAETPNVAHAKVQLAPGHSPAWLWARRADYIQSRNLDASTLTTALKVLTSSSKQSAHIARGFSGR